MLGLAARAAMEHGRRSRAPGSRGRRSRSRSRCSTRSSPRESGVVFADRRVGRGALPRRDAGPAHPRSRSRSARRARRASPRRAAAGRRRRSRSCCPRASGARSPRTRSSATRRGARRTPPARCASAPTTRAALGVAAGERVRLATHAPRLGRRPRRGLGHDAARPRLAAQRARLGYPAGDGDDAAPASRPNELTRRRGPRSVRRHAVAQARAGAH